MFKTIVKAKRGIATRTRNMPLPDDAESSLSSSDILPTPSPSSVDSIDAVIVTEVKPNDLKPSIETTNAGQRQDTLTVEDQIILYKTFCKYKPVGIHKHFNFLVAMDHFKNWTGRQLDPSVVWEHLHELYNLRELDRSFEGDEFPMEQVDFELPLTSSEFKDLKATPAGIRKRRASRTGF